MYFGGTPETVDYNPIESRVRGLSCKTVREYEHADVTYDAAFSISSFEHDGLGRYGDPLNPEGDLDTMRTLRGKLRPGGLLYLAVPVGADQLVWNAHRIYGRLRLPLLLSDWEMVDSFGFSPELFDGEYNCQPVFVLTSRRSH